VPPDVSEESQDAASASSMSEADVEPVTGNGGDAAEDDGSVAEGRFTCCGCNPPPFGNCVADQSICDRHGQKLAWVDRAARPR
jgi:hypothetical protein